MSKLLCKMYNHNKWWSLWWKIRFIDAIFYELHYYFCKELKEYKNN